MVMETIFLSLFIIPLFMIPPICMEIRDWLEINYQI